MAADVGRNTIAAGNQTASKGEPPETLAWTVEFCNDYAPLALSMAKLFIYLGLVMGVVMAAAEAYKLYRDAIAVKPAGAPAPAAPARATAVGEVIKGLAGVITGAKAWLALVIVGIVLFWLAGNAAPAFCTEGESQPAPRTTQQGAGTAAGDAPPSVGG